MIRLATADDAAAILEIYRPAIEGSTISFEEQVPSTDDMRLRIETCLRTHPWLVCEDQQGVCGYAYAGPHHPRAAYRWTANVSVYVADRAHRRGVARRLYDVLFAILRQQNVRTLIAGITVGNQASQAFHQKIGFQPAGVFSQVGFKKGEWLDVSWWQRPLDGKSDEAPSDFRLWPEVAYSLPEDLSVLRL